MAPDKVIRKRLLITQTRDLGNQLKSQLGRLEKVEVYASKDDFLNKHNPRVTITNKSPSYLQNLLENTPESLGGYHVLYVGEEGDSPEKVRGKMSAVFGKNGWAALMNAALKKQHVSARVRGIDYEGQARVQFGEQVKPGSTQYKDDFLAQKGLSKLAKDTNVSMSSADTDAVLTAAQSDYKRYERIMKQYHMLNADPKRQQAFLANWTANNVNKSGDLGRYAKTMALAILKDDPRYMKDYETKLGKHTLNVLFRKYKHEGQTTEKSDILLGREWNALVGKGKSAEGYLNYVQEKVLDETPGLAGHETLLKRRILDRIKSNNGRNDLSDWVDKNASDWNAEKINKLKGAVGVRGPAFTNTEMEKSKVIPKSTRQKIMAVALGYSDKGTGLVNPVRYIQRKAAQDPEVENIFSRNKENPDAAISELRSHLGSKYSVDYNEYVKDFGKMSKQERDKLMSSGINITHLPDIFPGEKQSRWGGGAIKWGPNSGSIKRKARISLLGTTKTVMREGQIKTYREQGRVGRAFSNAGEAVKRKVVPTAADIERKHKKEPYWTIMSEDQKKKLSVSRWPARLWQAHKAKKMYGDEAYAYSVKRKERERFDIQSAKYIRTEKEGEMRKKAASSAWWRLYYWGTHNTKVLLGIVLAIAVLFMPIGLFYVAGWALAVGVVTLIMFIIWVFMEFWWFIAQGIVSVINVVSQFFVGAMNAIGNALVGWLGFHFTPMQYTLVENMHLAEIDPITHQRRILGMTWGQWNLVPPSFMKLDSFMPKTFDTDSIIAKLIPAAHDFFNWFWGPIADRYTEWIQTAPWYYVGAIIGVPILLVIIAIVFIVFYVRRRVF